MNEMKVTLKHKPRIILTPMKRQEVKSNEKTVDQLIQALKTSPNERNNRHVDTLLSTVGSWDCFTKNIHSQQMRREVCRQIVYEEVEANSVLFKQGDVANGWYIVIQGQCIVVVLSKDDSFMADIPPVMVQNLRKALGQDQYFKCVFTAGPKCDFGAVALIDDCLRNATIYVSQNTILARVDNEIYRTTARYFAEAQREKRIHLLLQVKELACLHSDRDPTIDEAETFKTLAQNTVEFNVPAGTIIDLNNTSAITQPNTFNPTGKSEEEIHANEIDQFSKSQGFYLIAEGKISVHRMVDFSEYVPKTDDKVQDDVFRVKLPRGKYLIQDRELGPGEIFPDPRLQGGWISHQFRLRVEEPALLHNLKLSNLLSAVTERNVELIKKAVYDQPSDSDLIDVWIEKQRAKQWSEYKKKCLKEARRVFKIERQVMNGDLGMRRFGPPKALKPIENVRPLSRHAYEEEVDMELETRRRREKDREIEERRLNQTRKAIGEKVLREQQISREIEKRKNDFLERRRRQVSRQSQRAQTADAARANDELYYKQEMRRKVEQELQKSRELKEQETLRRTARKNRSAMRNNRDDLLFFTSSKTSSTRPSTAMTPSEELSATN